MQELNEECNALASEVTVLIATLLFTEESEV
jgi:hypothetical protein